MVSNIKAIERNRQRNIFLEKALDFDETYRQALTRVQFMKTRYKKAFEPDEDNYSLYPRSKRLISKFEYHQRKMYECEERMRQALSVSDIDAYNKADKEYEQYMKNCLYFAFGIGQLYTLFLEKAPSGLFL